ncbi:MAG TPA: hypothetical protein IGS52_03165 [Oscillatoriaceae cyanobacterium M33_DOE_052]|uniref:Uncharacterized protein n=1 Tax=Planktothricoides sp. SpSt-374 TaxID=2282167 RepID=A0A7C3ZYM8_9CYAN|nr:hypothetical protein [Oscillatoriaceae cyanobacterium M33_DOE_052]
MLKPSSDKDEEYIHLLLEPIAKCKNYQPRFGGGTGLTLSEFQRLYQADPFYSWFGLDSPLMYSAHKAAGGITSVYRQIGIGCQRLWQRILMDSLGLTAEQSAWSYQIQTTTGKPRTLSLDARITIKDVQTPQPRQILIDWLQDACRTTGVSEEISRVVKGVVFEVRQGYKSKDAKRQNADISNAAAAYSAAYLPVLLLLSNQIDADVANRYRNARLLILNGTIGGFATDSTYEFCRQIIGYDLADFFQRHSLRFKTEVESVLAMLLQ